METVNPVDFLAQWSFYTITNCFKLEGNTEELLLIYEYSDSTTISTVMGDTTITIVDKI